MPDLYMIITSNCMIIVSYINYITGEHRKSSRRIAMKLKSNHWAECSNCPCKLNGSLRDRDPNCWFYRLSIHHGQIIIWYTVLDSHNKGRTVVKLWTRKRHPGPRLLQTNTNFDTSMDKQSHAQNERDEKPFSNFNGCTVDVSYLIRNYILHFLMDVTTHPC